MLDLIDHWVSISYRCRFTNCKKLGANTPERCSLPSCHFRSGLALIWNRSWTSASSMTSVKAVQQSIGCRNIGPGFYVFSTLTQGVCTIGCCLDVKVFRCWEFTEAEIKKFLLIQKLHIQNDQYSLLECSALSLSLIVTNPCPNFNAISSFSASWSV